MDYKKRYEEAQKWIESIYTELNHERQMEAEAFFPELKESEDERIRKTFIRYVKDWQQGYGTWNTDKDFCNDAIAWLEKQGEQVLANSAKNCKIEPKFKVGDWVVFFNNHRSIYQIKKIKKYQYTLKHILGVSMPLNFCNEDSIRLWTINDAKDGDVLYSLDSKQPFIFKHRKPHEQAAVYCGINIYGKFFVENTNDCIITADKYIPADKFQRDLLFEKMNIAGYEWDAEKKKLKKTEQKSVEENNGNIGKTSSNWSEVDNVFFEEAIQMVESNGTWVRSDDAVKLVSDWLKSLKEKLTETKGGKI